eukprot:6197690-Pleurochrysis_carterae.AAC.4
MLIVACADSNACEAFQALLTHPDQGRASVAKEILVMRSSLASERAVRRENDTGKHTTACPHGVNIVSFFAFTQEKPFDRARGLMRQEAVGYAVWA